MIRYALKCTDDHAFESWFKSAQAFDGLLTGGHLACPVCGSPKVEKAVMAPQVLPSRRAAVPQAPVAAPSPAKELSTPRTKAELAMAELRRKIETESDYVGPKFVAEARKMHLGEIPERSIYGEARVEDAKTLLEEGIPVAPLPFVPRHKTN